MKTFLNILIRTCLVALGCLVILIGAAQFLAPSLPEESGTYDPTVMASANVMRNPTIDPNNPSVLYQQVDYREGDKADWYPKGQSPLLKQLVDEGKLPPVEQRVGPEPAVFKAVDRIGSYGGSWMRIAINLPSVQGFARYGLRGTALVRYSPAGYPIVPSLAKAYEVNDDATVFTFHLRKGIRWSDGHPFTADDIVFWWEYWAKWKDPVTGDSIGFIPETMKIHGQIGDIKKIDDYTVQYVFPETNAIFLEYMASARGVLYTAIPAHYARQYHPAFAQRAFLDQIKTKQQLASDKAVFDKAIEIDNPNCPSMSPWITRTQKSTGPFTMVRNPYYWAVDEQGNQLPYMDRIVFQIKNVGVENLALSNGEATFQQARFADYTLIMSQRDKGDYDVLHWYPSRRSDLAIFPNINLKIDPDKPQTRMKHAILNDVRFRRALSVAIDRKRIINAEWAGVGTPSQIEPGPASLFHSEKLANSYIEHDPAKANTWLDESGLTQRDNEGMRCFANGERMTFFMITGSGQDITRICQFIIEDWAKVGIRVMLQEKPGRLLQIEKFGRTADLLVGSDSSSHNPLTGGIFFPDNGHSAYASGYGAWYHDGGMLGKTDKGLPIPESHTLYKIINLFDHACMIQDPAQRAKVFAPALEMFGSEVYSISIATPPPQIYVHNRNMINVPSMAVSSFIDYRTPNNAVPEMWAYTQTNQSGDDEAAILSEITQVHVDDNSVMQSSPTAKPSTKTHMTKSLFLWAFWLVLAGLFALIAIRHPFVIRRLAIMVPTLLVISVIVFTMIQLPPGDYLESRINQLQLDGMTVSDQEIAQLRDRFNLDDPMIVRYFKWMGFDYFRTWHSADKGLLQGNLGLSMSENKPVNDIIGDRIMLTMLISAGTIMMTWMLAIPIGIYSAVKQYSAGDYVLTFFGFIGMCVPQFLLALIAIYLAGKYFNIHVSGLFSLEYALSPSWTWGKTIDLLKHIWIPILVLGVGGTAGMIRIMRANLLDELKRPYVTTARAKGVGPIRLLLKYPVRMALNPFISGIGGIFPELISGGAIVAMVLSLPTVGPLMIDAVMIEDTQLAGSMLMVLSFLGIVGVLISDLLLLAVDPRIRMGK